MWSNPTLVSLALPTLYPVPDNHCSKKESPARLQSIKRFIDEHPDEFRVSPPQDYSIEPILAVHEPDYVEFLAGIYRDWVNAGLPPEAVTGETFAHARACAKIDPAVVKKNASLSPSSRAGFYTFDMSVGFMKGNKQDLLYPEIHFRAR